MDVNRVLAFNALLYIYIFTFFVTSFWHRPFRNLHIIYNIFRPSECTIIAMFAY